MIVHVSSQSDIDAELARREEARLRNLPQVKDQTDPDYVPVIEDFVPSAARSKGHLWRLPSTWSSRSAVACFVLFVAFSIRHWLVPSSETWWASGTQVFQNGEWWRTFTALFTHSDMGHLLSNAPLFLIFGWFLRAFFGWLAFPLASFAVGILSNVATLATYPAQTHLLGASGMLYGMVALWLVFYCKFATEYPFHIRMLRAVGVSILLLFPTTYQKNVSYMAHFAGFLIGGGVGFALLPFIRPRSALEDRHPESRVHATISDETVPSLHAPSRTRVPGIPRRD